MSATTPKKAAAKPAKKATSTVRRSPRAAAGPTAPPAPPAEEQLSEEQLQALTDDQEEPELAPGEIRPVIIGKRGKRGAVPVQMVTLFEIDDVPYQIPKNPSPALVLRWLLDMQQHGVATASQRVGLTLLGEGPMNALAATNDLEPEDLGQIFENIGIVFFNSENYRKIMEAPDPS